MDRGRRAFALEQVMGGQPGGSIGTASGVSVGGFPKGAYPPALYQPQAARHREGQPRT